GSENDDLDRYIEIWNLVFMQFNRSADGSMVELPKPSVDTGMGLERIAAVLQGVHSNYEIDLFAALIDATAQLCGTEDLSHPSLRVIADHIRSCAFLIADGVVPGNEGRAYVLRRILRRAIRHGNKLGVEGEFFHRLVDPLVQQMGSAYPELAEHRDRIVNAIRNEEEQFARTLEQGMGILETSLSTLDGTVIPGDLVFKLYDTYGFPVDLTNDIARERGLTLDEPGYDAAMEAQRQRSKDSGSFEIDYNRDSLQLATETDFLGYSEANANSTVVALLRDGERVTSLSEGEAGVAVLDKTPFYGESGGQVGDQGWLRGTDFTAEVEATSKSDGVFFHQLRITGGTLTEGSQLNAEIDTDRRTNVALNHSATHLLHAALRKVLGTHVAQRGSLVDDRRLRFDFSHGEAMNDQELERVENLVNEEIRANTVVTTETMPMDEAMESGAMALFGEKYGDVVRVVAMGRERFSVELCGGTHVSRTGEIGFMKLGPESGLASGIRRIEAITGAEAINSVRATQRQLADVCERVRGTPANVGDKVTGLRQQTRELEKELARLKQKLAAAAGEDITSSAVEVAGVKVLAAQVPGADASGLRELCDQCKNKLGNAVIFLAAVDGQKLSLVAGVTKELSSRLRAGDLMREFAGRLGGKGGGRPDMAQGGGTDPDALPAVLEAIPNWVEAALTS
ncbi:MAG: alanine--tRNA ligase, partial [Pseudomonadota bacterium]